MFDIKLKNGKYFSNIQIWLVNTEEFIEDVELILQTDENLEITKVAGECETLEIIKNDDIEYICEAYKYNKSKRER